MEMFVFHRNESLDLCAVNSGVKGVVVDLEYRGKHQRQFDYDTQINRHMTDDLIPLKQHNIPNICRINAVSEQSEYEIQNVLKAGADEILVPMIRSLKELNRVLTWVGGRAKVGVMLETPEAVHLAKKIDSCGLSRIFIGLNDLAIAYQSRSIFDLLATGIVDEIRQNIHQSQFGYGGLTVTGFGSPLPAEYFVTELSRLECDFTFLRRSFFKACEATSVEESVKQIQEQIDINQTRNQHKIKHDQAVAKEQILQVLSRMQ